MTYLAPRQGLFAIIILISFCLQTLLLVLSTEQQLEKSRVQKGEQMVSQLINEASLALQNKDRVSLSVIAGRYTSEQDVAKLVIKDANDDLLVPLGNAPMQQGKTIRQVATKGDAVIGSVALTLKPTSKGEIIASQWPFVIGSLLLHLFLWLLYGYVARPTKAQINALSRDIHEYYRNHYKPAVMQTRPQSPEEQALAEMGSPAEEWDANPIPAEPNLHPESTAKKRWSLFARTEETDYQTIENTRADTNETSPANLAAQSNGVDPAQPNIQQALNEYIHTHQQGPSAQVPSGATHGNQSQTNTSTMATNSEEDQANSGAATHTQNTQGASSFTSQQAALSANRVVEIVDVRIIYDDKYHLLDKLAPETAEPYFILCSQLLNQAINELLKQPLLHGISLINEPRFDHSGALVVFKADNSHSKVALAGAMLGKLYIMLNQIIYDKHRELSRFALPVKVGISDDKQARPLNQLLKTVGRRDEMLMLFPKSGFKQVGNHMQVRNLQNPTTVYERESAFFDGTNEAMMQRLIDVRNAVLLTGNDDSQ